MPARRKSFYVGTRFPSKKVKRPIKVPPILTRPLQLRQRSLIKEDLIHKDPWYMTVHRRGVRRLAVGGDMREARAVPKERVRGTLPERIIYKWLDDHDIYFTFQSSLDGGRLEFGGIVADFILPDWMYVLNPTGPTHSEYIRIHKDEEQTMELAEFGYRQWFIPEDDCYNEAKFEDIMRGILGFGPGRGGSGAEQDVPHSSLPDNDILMNQIYDQIGTLQSTVEQFFLGVSA